MNENVVKDFIEHHGVLGMKWGRRGAGKSRTTPASSDYKIVAALKKRPTHQLTNKQLKTINERMNLEQNFSKMNPNIIKKGHSTATTIMTTLGLGVASYNLVKSPFGQALVTQGKKVLSKVSIKAGGRI